MARIKKKGTSGSAKNYITRSQAVRKLQVSLPDFRRLCIFKGIYPREPRSKKKASKSATPSTTFYYAKDVQYLLHEPLLGKFRDQKALAKKIAKALGRNEFSDAVRLEKTLTPRIRLDHIVKERYPTFVDALRDLDDALSVLFLFANLPASETVPAKVIAQCQRLTTEFEHFVIRTHCLRKSFLSIKGIYYQVTIEGQDILWLVPYRFVQRAGEDIDFRIMATFVDFYTALLGFVNFRLYTGVGLIYPPQLITRSQEHGGELGAFQLQASGQEHKELKLSVVKTSASIAAQEEADKIGIEKPSTATAEALSQSVALDKFLAIDDAADVLVQPSLTADSSVASSLFEGLTIFVSRECPRHSLEFILKAFGCKRVGWDSTIGDPGSYCAENDARITHQIVDRPESSAYDPDHTTEATEQSVERTPGRIYVQPQWVWDSINSLEIKRCDLYAPGATLPSHLSPWMKPRNNEYDPTAPLDNDDTQALIADASDEEASSNQAHREQRMAASHQSDALDDGSESAIDMDVQLASSESDDDDDESAIGALEDWDGISNKDDDEADSVDGLSGADAQYQAELEAESSKSVLPAGGPVRTPAQVSAAKKSHAERLAAEDIERRKMMMPRRKRKMYEKMVYSNARKSEAIQHLQQKRRKLEKQKVQPDPAP